MSGTQQRVVIAMKMEASKELVKFKVDGGRFESDKTIKLVVDTPYVMEFTLRPARIIESLNIQGGKVSVEEKVRNAREAVYSAIFCSSGTAASRRGRRDRLPIVIQMRETGSFTATLQCKFYAEKDKTHCKWGDVMNFIEYECITSPNATYLDIAKETFR